MKLGGLFTFAPMSESKVLGFQSRTINRAWPGGGQDYTHKVMEFSN